MTDPAYKRVYNSIRNQITGKKYDVGAILPPEPELEKEFSVSRTTIRRAIDLLVRDGFLSVRQGFGTQVISRKAVQNLNKFSSISESLAKGGRQIGLRSCYIEKLGAPEKIANLYNDKGGLEISRETYLSREWDPNVDPEYHFKDTAGRLWMRGEDLCRLGIC